MKNKPEFLYEINMKTTRYIELAKLFSTWSKDPSTKVGAVIIGEDGQVQAQGFNGFPRKFGDTEERWNNREQKYKYVIHAEANCLYNALLNGAKVKGSVMCVYGLDVCHECAKGIIQSGIKEVISVKTKEVSKWDESHETALEMFNECGVKYVSL